MAGSLMDLPAANLAGLSLPLSCSSSQRTVRSTLLLSAHLANAVPVARTIHGPLARDLPLLTRAEHRLQISGSSRLMLQSLALVLVRFFELLLSADAAYLRDLPLAYGRDSLLDDLFPPCSAPRISVAGMGVRLGQIVRLAEEEPINPTLA